MAGSQLETDDLTEYAVMWPIQLSAASDEKGRMRVGPSIEVPAKWNTGSRVNQLAISSNKVATAVVAVDREITVGSIMWRGRKQNLPNHLSNLYEVIDFKSTQDVKGRNVRYTAILASYHNTLPNSV